MAKSATEQRRFRFRDDPIGEIFIRAFLLCMTVITLYPFCYVLFLGFMPYENYISSPIHFLPSGFTLDYFKQILTDPSLPKGFLMSFLRVGVGVTFNLICTMMAAYALACNPLKYNRGISLFFMIPMFFSPGVIPFYLTINKYGLSNSFWALVLPNLVQPMWFFMARATLRDYPIEILEAAKIDGASHMRIFWRIIWPTNTPIITTLGVMYGVYHWNEYFYTRLLVQKNLWTAPVHLYALINEQKLLLGLGIGVKIQPQSYTAAVACCLIIPVLIVYPFLQRFIVSGLTAGSVKG